ncbi:hypothetical protein M1B74_01735 [Bacteroides pyogenes]|uniref:hypothetical protein n=1 Tax=Bacteroides pyogenes TaxID=310300 RepID=UPI003B42C83B
MYIHHDNPKQASGHARILSPAYDRKEKAAVLLPQPDTDSHTYRRKREEKNEVLLLQPDIHSRSHRRKRKKRIVVLLLQPDTHSRSHQRKRDEKNAVLLLQPDTYNRSHRRKREEKTQYCSSNLIPTTAATDESAKKESPCFSNQPFLLKPQTRVILAQEGFNPVYLLLT